MGDDSMEHRHTDPQYRAPATVQEYDKRLASMGHILQNLSVLNLNAGCYVWVRFDLMTLGPIIFLIEKRYLNYEDLQSPFSTFVR